MPGIGHALSSNPITPSIPVRRSYDWKKHLSGPNKNCWRYRKLQAMSRHHHHPQPPAKPKMDLSPYLIDPAALEPDRISYRVLIEVEHEPDFFKTMEFSPGEIFRYDEEYPTPRRLGGELNIDPSKATIDWPGGFKGSTYLIYSKAVIRRGILCRVLSPTVGHLSSATLGRALSPTVGHPLSPTLGHLAN